MIEIRKATEADSDGFTPKNGEMCYIAREGERIIGKCVFSFDGETVTLLSLEAENDDYMLADGLARSAVAGLFDEARYVRTDGEGKLLTKFRDVCGFFKDNSTKIENFAKSCC